MYISPWLQVSWERIRLAGGDIGWPSFRDWTCRNWKAEPNTSSRGTVTYGPISRARAVAHTQRPGLRIWPSALRSDPTKRG